MNHLDIGCGDVPRNPYHCKNLFAVDTRALNNLKSNAEQFTYRQSNFAIDPLPFESQFFDSVSAFDVIEHIPRQLYIGDRGMVYPFINLMNEIHRVLKPGGVFLATTPGFPRQEAFQDPTHVNIITLNTALYFNSESPLAAMYGFTGAFEIQMNKFCVRNNYMDRHIGATRAFLRRWHRKLFKGGWPHIIWEFKALPVSSCRITDDRREA